MTFPPSYKRLPADAFVKIRATGEKVELDELTEEYATWFAPMEESEFGLNENVKKNLWGYIGPGIDKKKYPTVT